MAAVGPEGDAAYLRALVRESDRPRYYSTLFSPLKLRADLFALYGFAAEISRVPDLVSEPALGEIRLQWWRDTLEAAAGAGQGETPAVRALSQAMARHALPIAPLLALVDARRRDLYSDPPATLAEVEGYFGETESSLFQLAAIICRSRGPETAEAAGHAGIAYGLARNLASFPTERARGRTILPLDLLAMEDLQATDVFAAEPGPGLLKTVSAMCAFARHHLRNARMQLVRVPTQMIPAFLPLSVAERVLTRVEQAGPLILKEATALSDIECLVRLGLARFRGLAAAG